VRRILYVLQNLHQLDMAVRNVVMGLVMLGLGILPVAAGSNASAASALRGSAAQIDQNNTGDTALEVKSADATFAMGIENESNANTSSQPHVLNNMSLKSAGSYVAWFYVDEHFRGEEGSFGCSGDIFYVGDRWNDKFTSLMIRGGYCVKLFVDRDFKGASKEFCAGKYDSFVHNVGSLFNDKTSSIKVWARR